MKKRRLYLTTILLIATLISACTPMNPATHPTRTELLSNVKQIDVDFENMSNWTVLDDSYIARGDSVWTEDGQQCPIYRVYFSGETVLLGMIPNYHLSMKHCELIYPYLYTFVSMSNPDDASTVKTKNNLLRIDLVENTFSILENNDGSIPGITTYAMGKKILTLKNIVEPATITTFIDSYNTESEEWERGLTYAIDSNTYIGEAIFGLCSDDEKIYVLYDNRNGRENIETFFKVFDQEYNEIKSIRVDSDIRDYVMSQFISYMQVFGDYIYIYNASNYGFLGRIVGDEFVEVFRGRNFELALDHYTSRPLFYERLSDFVYTLNETEGTLTEYKLQMGDPYTIMTIKATEDAAMVFCSAISDEGYKMDDYAYLVNREDMVNAYYPCR